MKKIVKSLFKLLGYDVRIMSQLNADKFYWAGLSELEVRRVFHYEKKN